jgi:hypothetical protein
MSWYLPSHVHRLGSLLRWIFHMICTWMVMIFGPWLSGAFFKPLLTWSCCYYFLIQLPTWSFCYYFLIQLPICCCFLLGCFCRSCLLRLKRGDNFLIFVNICSFCYLTGSSALKSKFNSTMSCYLPHSIVLLLEVAISKLLCNKSTCAITVPRTILSLFDSDM